MLKFKVLSEPSTPAATVGVFFYQIDGGEWIRLCWTLEDVVREIPGQPVESWKIHAQTAIPAGIYPVQISFSPHFKRMLPEILNVPGFVGVRIHGGNDAGDTEGCILVARNHPSRDYIQGADVDDVQGLLASHGGKATIEIIRAVSAPQDNDSAVQDNDSASQEDPTPPSKKEVADA